MDNSKSDRYLLIQKEIKPYRKIMEQASDTIVEKEISDFPIMVLFKTPLEIGVPVVDMEKVAGAWSLNASTLEEFMARQLIAAEKVESFKSLYESHPRHLCLFLVADFGADFVFLPR